MQAVTLLACAIIAHEPVRIDLDADVQRQVVVDREPGAYLGHVSTIRLDDRSILAAYPKGHGRGEIILKRSDDGGLTWSQRLPVPESWATSKETPTLHNLGDGNLLLFSGLFPIRAARSSDLGLTWTGLVPIGDFGGIVAMGGMTRRRDGSLVAFFHDDGRFLHADGAATGVFSVFQIESRDQGSTWSSPRTIWTGSDVHLCEPGVVVSPDGRSWALLLRENRRVKGSHIMFTNDEATTWTAPLELPRALTGDRHIAAYAPDGRLVVTFRGMGRDDPWKGDWLAWVGRWDDIFPVDERRDAGGPAVAADNRIYLVRLKNNLTDWDCGYAGLEVLADGTLVATTYGTWTKGELPSILCVRFTLDELDSRASKPADGTGR